MRYAAVRALAVFNDQARPAVPALLEALNDTDYTVRSAATNALERIAPEVMTSPAQKQ
jgi:HEAT repeat protein